MKRTENIADQVYLIYIEVDAKIQSKIVTCLPSILFWLAYKLFYTGKVKKT